MEVLFFPFPLHFSVWLALEVEIVWTQRTFKNCMDDVARAAGKAPKIVTAVLMPVQWKINIVEVPSSVPLSESSEGTLSVFCG